MTMIAVIVIVLLHDVNCDWHRCIREYKDVHCTYYDNKRVFVKKYLVNDNLRKGQLWLLADGPGRTSESSFSNSYVNELRNSLQYYDIYVMDYRGTGLSARFVCPSGRTLRTNNKRVFDSCVRSLNVKLSRSDLQFSNYSTDAVARDVINIIRDTRTERDTIALYGLGYGSYVLNRVLLYEPDLIQMAIVDNVMLPSYQMFSADDNIHQISTKFLKLCEQNSWCNTKFSSQVMNFTQLVLTKQSKGSKCLPHYYSSTQLKLYLGRALLDPSLRQTILPLLYRLYRCDKSDIGFLQNLYTSIYKYVIDPLPFDEDKHGWDSPEVFAIIAGSEFTNYTELPDANIYKSTHDKQPYFTLNRSYLIDTTVTFMKPLIYNDPFAGQYASNYQNSLLVFNSNLDKYSNEGGVTYYNELVNTADRHIVTCNTCSYAMAIQEPCAKQYLIHYLNKNLTNVNCSMPDINTNYFQTLYSKDQYYALTINTLELYEGGKSHGVVTNAVLITFIVGIFSCCILCCFFTTFICIFSMLLLKTPQWKRLY
jgi:pimeloyl-ACP methyl ester carboxylesterase